MIYHFKEEISNFIYIGLSFELTSDLMSKHEVKKMIKKSNILFCLPCSNVISTWLHHTYFYIIVKNNSSSVLSYHLFWYSCGISVRIQQNIRKVQKLPWISPFQVCDWLTLHQRRGIQIKITQYGDLDVHLLPDTCSWACFAFLSGQSQLSREAQHPMKCFLTFSSAAIVYSCYILLDPDCYTTWVAKQITF